MNKSKNTLVITLLLVLLCGGGVLGFSATRYLSLRQTIRSFATDILKTTDSDQAIAIARNYADHMSKQGVLALTSSAFTVNQPPPPCAPDREEGDTIIISTCAPAYSPPTSATPDFSSLIDLLNLRRDLDTVLPSPMYSNVESLPEPLVFDPCADKADGTKDKLKCVLNQMIGDGPEPKYFGSNCANLPQGKAWCVCAMYYALRQAGYGDLADRMIREIAEKNDLPALAKAVMDWAYDNSQRTDGGKIVNFVDGSCYRYPGCAGGLSVLRPGDIVFFTRGGWAGDVRTGHVGIVVEGNRGIANGQFYPGFKTIDGNWSNSVKINDRNVNITGPNMEIMGVMRIP